MRRKSQYGSGRRPGKRAGGNTGTAPRADRIASCALPLNPAMKPLVAGRCPTQLCQAHKLIHAPLSPSTRQ